MSTSCDDFTPPKQLLSVAEAERALLDAVSPVAETEEVGLFDALGRVLARDLVARRTVPPAANSAMDGYAVRSADLKAPETRLAVGGRIPAGHVFDRPMAPGEALRIFTGAEIPAGADAVVMQESARLEDGHVWLPPIDSGTNIRPAGEDFSEGQVVLPAGKLLLPQDIGQAASAGHARLSVRRRLRVAFFATGDEVREPGSPPEPGTIVNSNSFVLSGLLRRLGCEPRYLGIIRDRRELVEAALARAAAEGADAILTSGGVSMGEEDHVKAAVETLGALNFWRISIRPGRPLAFGRVGEVPFIGLPGNPVSTMVTFLMFARPMLLKLAGARFVPVPRYPVVTDFDFTKKAGRLEWLRGHLVHEGGRLLARPYPADGSGVFSSVVASSGLIELAAEKAEVRRGETVDYLSFADLLGA